ncbi:hypothetical protein AB0A94_27080 [Streptomyces sp. NPDC044984]|uniref:hypothetical protein n=1 Tax=Streptomyces sp. NPDC044984 TaxID=3154335 RepID=UPI0034003296
MRRGRGRGRTTPATAEVWTSPGALAADAVGEVTDGQRRSVAGRRTRPPLPARAALLCTGAVVVGPGVLVAVSPDPNSDLPEGRVAGPLAAMGLIALLFGVHTVPFALFAGLPRWRARRRRRRVEVLKACRVVGAPGVIGATGVSVAGRTIAVPDGSPPLPAPGTYWLYWLEPAHGDGEPLLLPAEPVDVREAAGRRAHAASAHVLPAPDAPPDPPRRTG